MPNIPYSWAAVITLVILLALAGWEIKHEIGRNATLTSDLSIAKSSLEESKKSQAAVTAVDTIFQGKKDEIKADQVKLDTAVAARTVILRVPAKCVPAPSATTGQPDEQRAELDPAFRPTHSALRAGIKDREAKIEGLQDYVNKVCLKL